MQSGNYNHSKVECSPDEQVRINARVAEGLQEWAGLKDFDLPASAIVTYLWAMGYKVVPRT